MDAKKLRKIAILTVQFDTVAKLYETDLKYFSEINNDNDRNVYVSTSPKVNLEFIKIGIGKKEIKELQNIETQYIVKNETKNVKKGKLKK